MRPTLLFLALFLGVNPVSAAEAALAPQNEAAVALTVAVAKPVERQWPETG